MTLGEGPPAGVLPTQTYVETLREETAQGEGWREGGREEGGRGGFEEGQD